MHLASGSRGLRRVVISAALAAGLVLLTLALSQCQLVNDSTLGVHFAKAGSSCLSRCAKAYNDSISVETALHLANVNGCNMDSTCLALEGLRHDAAVNRIQAGRDRCQNDCHHQGGGSGG